MKEKNTNEGLGSCCAPGTPCCESSESAVINEKKPKDQNKLNVDIFVPLEACSCEWSQFMNLVFTALTPYIKYINHETKSLTSVEARKLNLTGKCVMVDGVKKYTTSFALKNDLPKLLKEKGLI